MDEIFKEKIAKIAAAAAAAPSGDNSQPWRFVARAPNILEFHAMPEKDNALLNVDESGTLIALGAALQNAELEAKALGLTPTLRYNDEGSLVAILVLHEEGSLSDEERRLHEAIPLRHTNRKAYARQPLAGDVRDALLKSVKHDTDVGLSLIESRGEMKKISRSLTTMEEIALSNETLHALFFADIFWSEADNLAGKHGLHIDTLELPPPAKAAFRLLKYWSFTKALSKIGFHKVVAEMNAEQNASASAFGIITAERLGRREYVETGRLLERIWLQATAQGLSMQIVTGVTFLARSIAEPNTAKLFGVDQLEHVRTAYAVLKECVASSEPVLTFRIGTGGSPTAVSHRRVPEIIFA